MLDLDEVEAEIQTAMILDDRDALWRGLHDLQDAGVTFIRIATRHVMTNGRRVEIETFFPSYKVRVATPMTRAEKLMVKLRLMRDADRLEAGKPPRYFKHKNDMSPEEYNWVMGLW